MSRLLFVMFFCLASCLAATENPDPEDRQQSLQFEDPNDVPDKLDQALTIEWGDHVGILRSTSDKDAYAVRWPAGSTLKLILFPKTTGLRLSALDSLGFYEEMIASTDKIEFSFVTDHSTGSQKYSFQVGAVSGAGEYSFSITAVTQNDAGSGQDAPELAEGAVGISAGEYSALLGGGDTYDVYKVFVADKKTLTVKVLPSEELDSAISYPVYDDWNNATYLVVGSDLIDSDFEGGIETYSLQANGDVMVTFAVAAVGQTSGTYQLSVELK